MKSLGFASGETAVVPRTWDRGVVGCPTSRTETSKLTARAYLPHTSSHTTGDYHAVLGVSRFATKQEIKQSYRRLVLELHPDVCTGDHCSTRFLQVQRAYEVPTPPNFSKTFSQVSFTWFKLSMAPRIPYPSLTCDLINNSSGSMVAGICELYFEFRDTSSCLRLQEISTHLYLVISSCFSSSLLQVGHGSRISVLIFNL